MIYLDNAATTWPKPETVYQAMDDFIRNKAANPGRAAHQMAKEAGELVFTTRNLLADFFNAKSSQEIIFTASATEALNLAIKGFLKSGDHVITTSLEHNSVLRPLKELESQGVELSIIEVDAADGITSATIKENLQSNTTLVAITHASNVTGVLSPIKKIGELLAEKEVKLLVDAAQTAGLYPIDVQQMKIDMLSFPGHKGLFGPAGIGGLYLSEDVDLKPLISGGTGSYSEELYQPQIRPDRYESGTANTSGIAGLKAGLEFIIKEGRERIKQHESKLLAYLIEELTQLEEVTLFGPLIAKEQAPVISLNFGDESSGEIGYILDKAFDVAVRTGLHCAPLVHESLNAKQQGTVRLSPGYFNTEAEIKEVISILNKIAAEI